VPVEGFAASDTANKETTASATGGVASALAESALLCHVEHASAPLCHVNRARERENFITRQSSIREKDDYDIENSWMSDGLPSSSRRRRRGEGRARVEREGECEVDVGVDGAKSEIKVERSQAWL